MLWQYLWLVGLGGRRRLLQGGELHSLHEHVRGVVPSLNWRLVHYEGYTASIVLRPLLGVYLGLLLLHLLL